MLVATLNNSEAGQLMQLLALYASGHVSEHEGEIQSIIYNAKLLINIDLPLTELVQIPLQARTLAWEAISHPSLKNAIMNMSELNPSSAKSLLAALNDNAC